MFRDGNLSSMSSMSPLNPGGLHFVGHWGNPHIDFIKLTGVKLIVMIKFNLNLSLGLLLPQAVRVSMHE